MKLPAIALCWLSLSGLLPAFAQSTAPHLSAQQWQEDLHYLAQEMPKQHKSLFHTMTQAQFEQAVHALDVDIPHLNDDEIVVRLAQIGAMVKDGHSGLELLDVQGNVHIPVLFVQYSDGVYVRAAAPEYGEAVGGRVVMVGDATLEEAMKRIDTIAPMDPGNSGHQAAWAARLYLNYPMLLHGLGLSASSQSADFTIEKQGQRKTYTMRSSAPVGQWYLFNPPPDWVDARPPSVSTPLSIGRANELYWFTAVPEHRAVYFQFNGVMNADGEALEQFADRLASAINQDGVDRLIIDARNNPGGNNTLLRPLLVTLISSKLNHRGGMYCIIGPRTFSAAQNFVDRLESYTNVIFVGEPTGENVNMYGDPNHVELPNSHLGMSVAHLWWQDKDPRDTRVATAPELASVMTFQDYIAGRDPALQLALTTPTPATLQALLTEALTGGVNEVLPRYNAWISDPVHRYAQDPESQVNALGYQLMGDNRIPDAITIFQVNVRTHPDSWNAWDSLGEAYANAHDKQNALQAYRKSVELNPKNSGGQQMIEKLEKMQ
jgi:tetratricopeptide (TPR) repeat protein